MCSGAQRPNQIRRRNQRLKDRAGLVGIRHQTKVHVLGLGVFQIGLVVGRIRAGGQDLSSRRVGHQGRPFLAFVFSTASAKASSAAR